MNPQELWRRAWLQELGVEWRGPLPSALTPSTDLPKAAEGRDVAEPVAEVEPSVLATASKVWRVPGRWRWSWWTGTPGEQPEAALLLRQVAPQRESDAAARALLAAALSAVGLRPLPRRQAEAGGVLASGLDQAGLAERIQTPPQATTPPVSVILCWPDDDLIQSMPQAGEPSFPPEFEPGRSTLGPWGLPCRLVVLPAPERMLREGAPAKRQAWQALCTLRAAADPKV